MSPDVAAAPGRHHPSRSAGSRGRPRSPRADADILSAALHVLVADGYDGLSMERVATRAAVAKSTVYRRYPTKRDLVLAALGAGTDVLSPMDPASDTRTALASLVRDVVHGLVDSGAIRVLATLLVADAREPGLMDEFRSRIITPRRLAIAAMLERGIERGELRPDLDPLVVTEMLAGAVVAHHLVLGRTSDPSWVEALTDTLWRAMATSTG